MKRTKIDKRSVGKFLALILRHKPEVIGVILDENGWADTKALINKTRDYYRNLTVLSPEMLQEIVDDDNKNRYELSTDKSKIRARQGHSLSDVDLGLDPVTPPDTLYHGTVQRYLEPIFEEGLIKGSRQYVHLSQDMKTAVNVGNRRGKAIILTVDSKQMSKDKIPFYLSSNGVWLTNHVPSKYIIAEYSINVTNK